ncbi:Glutathione S-transferase [Cordyceps fumosorosea ARSEF 2679]|uniref:Glutathione S-transferase n=1 Tax=Cordyceps fumosorosea (strain ARSEF 2679) TaxID=1081104 RepID=A0A167PBX2_CORFA|nr:Glutathione S-transferase [Cordyceps fumosorosea ARSEF 2679]OAA56506.1 Glutathione S-transferase [Cordyceps fumosorosea ARSEF 2679]
MSLKPITVYNHGKFMPQFNSRPSYGPNPKKVNIILEELSVPYKLIVIENPKDEEYRKINPNGRLPAIIDPNNDSLTLWESGAIAEYLVETYDKENKINATAGADKWHLKQFLLFQMSGQGPYYGQGVWFHKSHGEDVPSAKKRYLEQMERVWSVLDDLLKGQEYLLGSKLTYVDLCFVPWEFVAHNFLGEELKAAGYNAEKKYPNYWAWYQRLLARPSVKKTYGL